MDSQTYFHAVRRTAKADHIDPAHEKFNWMISAMGEVSELHDAIYQGKSSVIDETGDILWYMANFCHAYFLDYDEIIQRAELFVLDRLMVASKADRIVTIYDIVSELARLMKVREFHRRKKIEDEQFASTLVDLHIELCALLEDYEVTLEQAMQANIDKLAERYPTKFDG